MVDTNRLREIFFSQRTHAEANASRMLESIYNEVLALLARDDVKTVADLRPVHLGRKITVQTPDELTLAGYLTALTFEETNLEEETNVSLSFKGDIAPRRVAQTWLCFVQPTDEELSTQYEQLINEPAEGAAEDPLVAAAAARVRAAIRSAQRGVQAARDVVEEAQSSTPDDKPSLKADIASAVSDVVAAHSKDKVVTTAQQTRRFVSVGATALARAAREKLDQIDKSNDQS